MHQGAIYTCRVGFGVAPTTKFAGVWGTGCSMKRLQSGASLGSTNTPLSSLAKAAPQGPKNLDVRTPVVAGFYILMENWWASKPDPANSLQCWQK